MHVNIYVCSLAIKMPLKVLVVNLVFNFKYFSVGKEQFN
jgi:hypothetical protein